MKQTLVIRDWVPPPVLNGSHGHWSRSHKRAKAGQVMAWTSARQAGWTFVPGRVRLTIVLVFSVNRRRDTDNLYARCKHLIDGLKSEFFFDDSTDWLDLLVRAEVVKGVRETRMELEPA